MIDTKKPNGQFGIWREPEGGFRLEFYRPDGFMVSRTTFDAEAAREFLDAVAAVVQGEAAPSGCRACGAPDHPSGCADDLPNLLAGKSVDLRATMEKLAALMERPPLSERDAGRISERTEAFQDAAAMIRLALAAQAMPRRQRD